MDGTVKTYVLEADGKCLCHTCYGPGNHRTGCPNAPAAAPQTVTAARSAGCDIILDGQEYEVLTATPVWNTDDTWLTLRSTQTGRRRSLTLPDERPLDLAPDQDTDQEEETP